MRAEIARLRLLALDKRPKATWFSFKSEPAVSSDDQASMITTPWTTASESESLAILGYIHAHIAGKIRSKEFSMLHQQNQQLQAPKHPQHLQILQRLQHRSSLSYNHTTI